MNNGKHQFEKLGDLSMNKILKIVIVLILVWCVIDKIYPYIGFDQVVADNTISVGKMTVELPDGKWKESRKVKDFARVEVYQKKVGSISLYTTDEMEYDYDVQKRYSFEQYPDGGGKVYYINGYRTRIGISDEWTVVSIIGEDINYLIRFEANDKCANPEKVGMQIAKGISFDADADDDYAAAEVNRGIVPWGTVNDCAKDSYAEGSKEIQGTEGVNAVRGTVKKVRQSSGNTYMDIGDAYPNEDRVTAVVWAEDASNFGEDLTSYEGKEVFITGEIYLNQNCANVKLKYDSQIVEIADIEDIK